MKSKVLPLVFSVVAVATAAAAPAFARTAPAVETFPVQLTDDGSQSPAIAVASACVTNTTGFRIAFVSNWGLDGERWQRLVLNPGDTGLYRLVLDAERVDTSLTLRFPAAPMSRDAAEQAIPATWGSVREDDCTKLPSFDFVKQDTDGGDSVFAITPSAPHTK